MKRLALLGASGHGKVVADAALAGPWSSVDFYDDAWPQRTRNGAWSIVGDGAALLANWHQYDGLLVSIGNATLRWDRQQGLEAAGASLATVVHPAAVVSRHAVLGPGSAILAGAVVGVDAVLGRACIVNTGATVDHDCQLADAVHIAPGAHLAGDVHVGHGSWVGLGAVVRQGIRIGRGALIGAGAVVVAAVADGAVVVGNPARPRPSKDT